MHGATLSDLEAGCRSVSGLPQLLPQLESILFPIMQRMVSTEGQDVFEDVLEIVAYFTFFSPEVRPMSSASSCYCADADEKLTWYLVNMHAWQTHAGLPCCGAGFFI